MLKVVHVNISPIFKLARRKHREAVKLNLTSSPEFEAKWV